MNMDNQEAGGFIRETGLPSPSPSSTSTASAAGLPLPRSKSLQPGSNKEGMVRRYVEDRLLNTSRRYVKKFSAPDEKDTIVGFQSFSEVAKELDGLVNVLWRSGTPTLQIPFLLRIASDFTQYVRSFPPAPRSTFSLLRKLDHCFASLLSGLDVDTKESLPGFENGLRAGITTTDMVRCRSLVEQTRFLMVEIMGDSRIEDEEEEEEEETEDDSQADGGPAWDIDEERLHMDAARVYELTIVKLGERMGDPLGNELMQDTSTVCQ